MWNIMLRRASLTVNRLNVLVREGSRKYNKKGGQSVFETAVLHICSEEGANYTNRTRKETNSAQYAVASNRLLDWSWT